MAQRPGAPFDELDDQRLAALASAGDRAAFGELVRRHGSAVRGLLRRMGAAPALADDLAQDAFLSAFEHIGDFRGEGSFAGWVKRIAARLYVRRWRRRGVLDPVDPVEETQDEGAGGESERIARIDLDLALQALSPAERICVGLCHGAGLSHPEIAEALRLPLGTVKSHVTRGLAKLRQRLSPNDAAPVERRRAGSADHV